MDSSRRLEFIQFTSIEENGDVGRRDTAHNKTKQPIGEVERFKDFMNEIPF